jgi:hypothetical protein
LIRVVFEPEVQSVPKMASGPTKKKMVAARKMTKKTITPIEKRPSRQAPLFYFFDMPFIDPERPATPSSRNRMEER